MGIVADIVERPPRATYDRQGYAAVRTFLLTGVTGGSAAVYNALSYTGVPARGDAHPGTSDMLCDVIEAEAIDTSTIQVTCTYRHLSGASLEPSTTNPPLVSVGASVQQQDIGVDNTGAPLVIDYTDSDSNVQHSFATASIQVPNSILRLTRREPSAPTSKGQAIVGCVNSSTFYGATAGQILCTRCEGNSPDDGVSWIVEYEFQFNPNTWKFAAWYTDQNNQIPADATTTNGYAEFDIYPTYDFTTLGL